MEVKTAYSGKLRWFKSGSVHDDGNAEYFVFKIYETWEKILYD